MTKPFSVAAIAHIRSPFKEKFGTPRQGHLAPSAEAEIEFLPQSPAEHWLSGIEGFSHLWLIFVFHENVNEGAPPKVAPPRLAGKKVGVLASRSPHRPNPLGLTLVEVVECSHRTLKVRGLDLLDGTPILDIKPFVSECDSPHSPVREGWIQQNPWQPLTVKVLDSVHDDLDRIYQLSPPPIDRDQLLTLAKQVVAQDPRAVVDRGSERRFWLRLYDVDFGFHILDSHVEIRAVRFAFGSDLFARFEKQKQGSSE